SDVVRQHRSIDRGGEIDPAPRDGTRKLSLVEIRAGVDGHHALGRFRGARVDVLDRGVGVLASMDGEMKLAGIPDVVGVFGIARDQCGVLAALDRRPNHLAGLDLRGTDRIESLGFRRLLLVHFSGTFFRTHTLNSARKGNIDRYLRPFTSTKTGWRRGCESDPFKAPDFAGRRTRPSPRPAGGF